MIHKQSKYLIIRINLILNSNIGKKLMFSNASKQKLKLAHEVLDKELSNASLSRNQFHKTPTYPKQTMINSSIDQKRTKHVQSQISDLERKLLDLQKKMENIDVSSSNEDDQGIVVGGRSLANRLDDFSAKNWQKNDDKLLKEKEKLREKQRESEMQKIRTISKNLKESVKSKPKIDDQQSEEDSCNDGQIYARIQSQKQRKLLQQKKFVHENQTKPKSNDSSQNPVTQINKAYAHSQDRRIVKQPISNQNIPESKKIQSKENQNRLRNSVTSKKSIRSTKSNNSKLQRSSSKKSLNSNKSITSLNKGGQQMHQAQVENAKDIKKISNLQRELNHYKRLSHKQQQKLEQYRVMQIEYRKLQANFNKSEQIRKQQKKIIQNLKSK